MKKYDYRPPSRIPIRRFSDLLIVLGVPRKAFDDSCKQAFYTARPTTTKTEYELFVNDMQHEMLLTYNTAPVSQVPLCYPPELVEQWLTEYEDSEIREEYGMDRDQYLQQRLSVWISDNPADAHYPIMQLHEKPIKSIDDVLIGEIPPELSN